MRVKPRSAHPTVEMLVWVDVDAGIAQAVQALNLISGVRTYASCQGTLGEGGDQPYRAQVMASWPPEALPEIEKRFEIEVLGEGWGYLHPRSETK